MEFEKLKKNDFSTDRPIPEKQGRVRGNENIFKVGPSSFTTTPRSREASHKINFCN